MMETATEIDVLAPRETSYALDIDGAVARRRVLRRVDRTRAIEVPSESNQDLLSSFFARLDAREQVLVRLAMHVSRNPSAMRLNATLNQLGNGWLYLITLVCLPLAAGSAAIRPVLAASIAVGIAFILYGLLKPFLARTRPCDADWLVQAYAKPLDKYSCPSGHTMTATAIAIPLAIAFPFALPAIVMLALLIAWSRVACGHHYPSDVLLGAMLGAAVAMPICGWLL
jgi:undecaprenyl-diphosphatase